MNKFIIMLASLLAPIVVFAQTDASTMGAAQVSLVGNYMGNLKEAGSKNRTFVRILEQDADGRLTGNGDFQGGDRTCRGLGVPLSGSFVNGTATLTSQPAVKGCGRTITVKPQPDGTLLGTMTSQDFSLMVPAWTIVLTRVAHD